eukprot:scaffold206212_cov43-Cyclotella_meneghiniana.AAC.1
MNQKKLKWKFANGMVESVLKSGMILANNPDDNTMILKSNSTSDSNMKWIRTNTRLLASNSAIDGWKQDWKVTFVDSEYKEPSVAEFIQEEMASNAKCYNINSAFSASFDEFAKELVVKDASDENQCRKVREALGFDKDYPFDVEVRDNFYQHQCDPFFTGIDHTSGDDMEALSAPPKFEMVEYTPVEYEAIEYDEKNYVTIDYEEFSKGDDLGELTETKWPDLYIPAAGLGDLTGIFSDDAAAEDQKTLEGLQRDWILLRHLLVAAEHVWEFASASLALACVPNPAAMVCGIASLFGKILSYGILFAATLAYEQIDRIYEIATLGPNTAIYGQYYSRANYHNIRGLTKWNEEALDAIHLNMKNQHQEMKRQLQERHKDIANHVGQDIADAQNALGRAIVDAQNDIGQEIVDSQNALGQGIVDAQNALGQDIVDTSNYITKQHNVLSEWLHENLCIIYKALQGTCARAIGPLEKNQAHIPMQLYWPEGQLNIMDKIDQLQTILPPALQDNLVLEGVGNVNISSDGGLNTIKAKMDALSSYVQENVNQVNAVERKVDAVQDAVKSTVDAVESTVDAVESKVDAVESKVDAVESKVDAVQDELSELKVMMTKLMEMLANQ